MLVVPSHPGVAQAPVNKPPILIYAGPLHRDYIGCLDCDQFDGSSIWNDYSSFGLGNAYPYLTHYANYHAAHGRYSACDPLAEDPPVMINNSHQSFGVLNISETRADSICGPHGDSGLCQKLKAICRRGGQP